MIVTAIIAEYNPFHKGHLYQLTKAKEETCADYIIVVLAGNYVQRGTPAIMDKYSRAKMALLAGADLVIELPVCYSTSSIEHYAASAVSLLDKLGCVNYLSFGSECGDINKLYNLALRLPSAENELDSSILDYTKSGMNYPAARERLLSENGFSTEDIKLMNNPNNSLGIAYIRAILSRHSCMKPHTVQRIVSKHNEITKGAYSATAVRSLLSGLDDTFAISEDNIPPFVYDILCKNYKKNYPLTEDDFSDMLLYKIHSSLTNSMLIKSDMAKAREGCLNEYLDVSSDLSSKIISVYRTENSFTSLADRLKSRDITYARICRALTHILLDIKTEQYSAFLSDDYHYYARVIGLKTASSELLHMIKVSSSLPLLTKLADYKKTVESSSGKRLLFMELQASELYEKTACSKYRQSFVSEFSKEIIKQ